MALEALLNDLKSINGYMAAGIMNFTGEVLAADSSDNSIDLNVVGASFNDIFRAGHDVAGKVGFGALHEATLQTPNGVIVMVCSGVDAPVHLHLIAVLKADGNQALAKMTLEKVAKNALAELQ